MASNDNDSHFGRKRLFLSGNGGASRPEHTASDSLYNGKCCKEKKNTEYNVILQIKEVGIYLVIENVLSDY